MSVRLPEIIPHPGCVSGTCGRSAGRSFIALQFRRKPKIDRRQKRKAVRSTAMYSLPLFSVVSFSHPARSEGSIAGHSHCIAGIIHALLRLRCLRRRVRERNQKLQCCSNQQANQAIAAFIDNFGQRALHFYPCIIRHPFELRAQAFIDQFKNGFPENIAFP